jgi:cytochrome c oxidase cbb3-type subunit IV
MSTLLSIWTVVVLILFTGIVIWAWSGRNKARFEEDARIPFDEPDEEPVRDRGER